MHVHGTGFLHERVNMILTCCYPKPEEQKKQ